MTSPLYDDLLALASDLWWAGQPRAIAFWSQLDPALWEDVNHSPVALLQELGPERVALNPAAKAEATFLLEAWRAHLATPRIAGAPSVAYFCMEYGLHECLPIYSGGLGMLAGDHLKSADAIGVPLVAVGLFWREGYFKQVVHDGQQSAAYGLNQPERLPIRKVVDADGAPVRVAVPCGHRNAYLEAWEVRIGHVRLFLLDADVDGNDAECRALTQSLYMAKDGARIRQEVLLGVGGVRLLRALSIEPDVYHMNEGHAAFLTLELWTTELARGTAYSDAWAQIRERCVFTTHTPVPAGHDRFFWGEVDAVLGPWRHRLGLHPGAFMDLGRVTPANVEEPLGMTVLGIRGSRAVNGVSALHGEVSRQMWSALDFPIGHITNGVHPGAWLAPETEALWDDHLPGWRENLEDAAWWQKAEDIDADAVLSTRDARRRRLVAALRRRLGQAVLDADRLTIGFARRFAPYKRADLLFADPDRLAAILDQGVQVIYAGKAHPADKNGQAIMANVLRQARDPRFRGQVVFVPDYDMEIGRLLTGCCDVWLNNPRRPREASGTSGQKAAMNGNLNLSVLDGWWPEGFDGDNGWAIGRGEEFTDAATQDASDADHLYETLETGVIPTFANPARWAAMSRHAMATCTPAFNTHRMVRDYLDQLYRA